MNLVLGLKNKVIILFSLVLFLTTASVKANPIIAGEVLPPASAVLITDPSLIGMIGVGREDDPVWCYNSDANAILITAPERERQNCTLQLSQETSRLVAEHKLELGTLSVQFESLVKRHDELLAIKNKEIENLTAAALKRPSDYSLWWATGGAAAGAAITLAIVFSVGK